jgi:hypothetical protein
MVTRRLVPRSDGEGGIGSTLKRWLSGHFVSCYGDNIYVKKGGAWQDIATPKRSLVLLGSSFMYPEMTGASPYEDTLPNGQIIRGAAFGVSQTAVTAQIGLPMPSNWDGGAMTAQFVFTTTGTAGTVMFTITGVASVNGDLIDQTFGIPSTVTLDIGAQVEPTAWKVWTTEMSGDITLTGTPTGEDRRWIQFEVSRDAGDTCPDDVVLLAVIVEYGTSGYSDA